MTWCLAVRVNETDTFADEDGHGDEYFDFEDISGTMPGWCIVSCWNLRCVLAEGLEPGCRDLSRGEHHRCCTEEPAPQSSFVPHPSHHEHKRKMDC